MIEYFVVDAIFIFAYALELKGSSIGLNITL